MPKLKENLLSYTEIKDKAKILFKKASLPSNEQESWRKIRLSTRANFSPFFEETESRTNIQLLDYSSEQNDAQDIRFIPLRKALQEEELSEILEELFKNQLNESTDFFSLENLAKAEHDFVLIIPQNLKCSLKLLHNIETGNSVIHRVIVCLMDFAELDLVEEYIANTDTDNNTDNNKKALKNPKQAIYWNTVTRAYLGNNSKLRYLSLRNYGKKDYHFQHFLSEQKRDSEVFYGLAHGGACLGKDFVESRLVQKNTNFRGVGIYAGTEQEFNDLEMLVNHQNSHSHSSLLYKAIVSGQAHSVFDGKLKIAPHLKDVDSLQTNHNLVLSPNAHAESIPRLVIRAEDVSCEHSATVANLNEEALFYLLARGISHQNARHLIIEGFLNDSIQEFPLDTTQKENLLQEFKERLIKTIK